MEKIISISRHKLLQGNVKLSKNLLLISSSFSQTKHALYLVVGLTKNIPGLKLNVPEGAFYVFPDVSSYFGKTLRGKLIDNADDFSMYLLSEANVATVTGDAFGNPNCIRISYATSEDLLTEAFKRIREALA